MQNYKVRARVAAVRMVRVLNMSVDETASILVHCPTWVRDWLRRYDEGGLEGLRDSPRCGRPRRISQDVMDAIVANVAVAASRIIYFAYTLLMYNMWVCANVELAQSGWDGEPVIAQITFLEILMVVMFKIIPEPELPP